MFTRLLNLVLCCAINQRRRGYYNRYIPPSGKFLISRIEQLRFVFTLMMHSVDFMLGRKRLNWPSMEQLFYKDVRFYRRRKSSTVIYAIHRDLDVWTLSWREVACNLHKFTGNLCVCYAIMVTWKIYIAQERTSFLRREELTGRRKLQQIRTGINRFNKEQC